MKIPIILQQQPCQTSCVCTSIAMLLNIPAALVIKEHHEEYRNGKKNITDILDFYGVHYLEFYSGRSCKLGEEILTGYFLGTVPSLNNIGGFHEILVGFDDEEFEWQIADPQAGVDGVKYYTANKELIKQYPDIAYPLTSYIVDAFIPIEEVKRIQKL